MPRWSRCTRLSMGPKARRTRAASREAADSTSTWDPARVGGTLSDDEAVAHGVLRHHARLDELQQVAGPAGLGARPREAVAAERLAADHRARDRAVDVEVADRGAVDDVVHGV